MYGQLAYCPKNKLLVNITLIFCTQKITYNVMNKIYGSYYRSKT